MRDSLRLEKTCDAVSDRASLHTLLLLRFAGLISGDSRVTAIIAFETLMMVGCVLFGVEIGLVVVGDMVGSNKSHASCNLDKKDLRLCLGKLTHRCKLIIENIKLL